MADWKGHWTQNQKDWGSVLPGGHVYMHQIDFLFHTVSVHPAVMGT